MANTLNTLYPPMIETFMPAFIYNTNPFISFSYSPYNSKTEIKRIHVTIVNQKTNKSILKTTYIPTEEKNTEVNGVVLDHIWIFDTSDLGTNNTTFTIPKNILRTDDSNFQEDTFYKIQLRFDKTSTDIVPTNTDYLITQRWKFSEWSSVCLIKAIDDIYIKITNNSRPVQPGIVPIAGTLIKRNDSSSKERLQKYKIKITGPNDNIIDESDWIYTGNQQDDNSIYWLADLTNTITDTLYTVQIKAVTKNQYELSTSYQLKIANYSVLEFNPQWEFTKVVLNSFGNQRTEEEKINKADEQIVTEEDGEVSFKIIDTHDLPAGFLYVKRATSLDNFKKWELISCVKHVGVLEKTFTDSTVGSLVKYRYACQYQLAQKNIFTPTFFSPFVYPKFYDILLYRQNKQIAIRYNEQVTSYAPVVNRQIINTLGGKYPKFAENANMNYKKITISGLLSVEADFNRKFINDRNYAAEMNDYDEYMNGKYEIRNDTIADGYNAYTNVSSVTTPATYDAIYTNWEDGVKYKNQSLPATLHDLFPKDNWWLEREFREQALAWLNDGEPKLFRSMTEGNLAVILTDISLTPNNQVGRRTYNISMTAYEIGDGYSLDTLSTLGIITIPNEYEEYKNNKNQDEQDEELMTTVSTIGQMYSKQSQNKDVFYLINSEKPYDDIDEYTLNDLITNFYKGALQTYQIDSNTFELRDLKIHFESKPQWYYEKKSKDNKTTTLELVPANQDSANQEIDPKTCILGYKIGINTKTKNNTSENIIFVNQKGYYQIPSNVVVTNIILYDHAKATFDYKLSYKRTWNEILIPTEIEITQRIIGQISGQFTYEQKIGEEIKNKYEYYRLDNDREGVINEHQYLNEITGIGFDGTPYTKLDIRFTDEQEYKSFLVGQTGVYDLMTDCSIKEVIFKGRQMFRKYPFNYIVNYKRNFVFDNSAYTKVQAISGENNNAYSPIKFVFSDKSSYQTIIGINNNFEEEEKEPYDSITAIGNPQEWTVYGVKKNNEVELWLYQQKQFVPFNISPIGDIVVTLNKPMYKLREWEFFLDESAIIPNNISDDDKLYWQEYYLGKTNQEVNFQINNNEYSSKKYIYKIGEETNDIYNPILNGYKTTEEIEPKFNTVYGFQKENSNSKIYKIYYIDGKWYDVDYDIDNPELILAKVPVYGMVNYKGNLIKIQYDENTD